MLSSADSDASGNSATAGSVVFFTNEVKRQPKINVNTSAWSMEQLP